MHSKYCLVVEVSVHFLNYCHLSGAEGNEKQELFKDTFLTSLIETLTVQKLMRFTVLNTNTNTERILCQFSSVQSLCRVRLFVTPWITARQAPLSITNSRSSTKLMSIESVMPSSHLILCHPLLLLPPLPPSITVFSNESTLLMRWPKYWSFSFSIGPSNQHPGLISFRMDWLNLLYYYYAIFADEDSEAWSHD